MTPSLQAHQFLLRQSKRHHAPLHMMIKSHGPIELKTHQRLSLFEFLARTVVNQQLSEKAARTIWRRLQKHAKGKNKRLQEVCVPAQRQLLKSCGISKTKTEALLRLAEQAASGQLHGRRITALDYEGLSQWTAELYGCGQWTADMVAMFYRCLPDVWPRQDIALLRGLHRVLPGADMDSVAELYRPYRSTLARHIWRAGDTKP